MHRSLSQTGGRDSKATMMRLICSTAVVACLPLIAQAQEQAVEEVVVTGSRIGRSPFESVSSVAVISSEQVRETGATTVDEILNQLPQIAGGDNASSTRGDGIVTVDLRSLGPSRTLVLVNGRRLVPTTTRGVVDLNNVPTSLIERVDVVTGGASAVYGSDALGGVVNFVLKNNFEGFQFDARYGGTTHGDGPKADFSVLMGADLDNGRGNVTLFGSYTDREAVLQRDRNWARLDINGGSPTNPAGRFDNIGLNPFPTAQSFLGSGGSVRDYVFNRDGTVHGNVVALPEVNPAGDNYNIPALNHLQTPMKRISMSALGHYNLGSDVEVFFEGLFTDNRVKQQQAPTPATNLFVSPANPLLTTQVRALLAARPNPTANAVFRKRFLEVGPRVAENNSDAYQMNVGLRGVLGDWKWEGYYGYGRSEFRQYLKGDVSRSRVQASLLGCPVGSAVLGCRVIDFFGPGKMTAADIDYVSLQNQVDTLTFERQVVSAFVSGSLLTLPAGDVEVAVGAEYRKDTSVYDPSEAGRRNDQLGFNQKLPTSGSFSAKEAFGELVVPVLRDQPFAQSLTVELGGRYADYSTVGSVFTWKAGAQWQPIDDLRVRGMFQQATRAPSVFELFQAGDLLNIAFTDPCARILSTGAAAPAPSQAVATVCQLQGTPNPITDPTFTQISRTIDVYEIGNSQLRQETAKTFTVGVVATPRFAPGLTVSVDYFDIKVENYINRAFGGINGVIGACYGSGATTAAQLAANPACSLLTRDASAQLIGRVPLQNTTPLRTSGWDFQANYGFDLAEVGAGDLGHLTLNAAATYTQKFTYNNVNYVGLLTQDFQVLNLPSLRSNVSANWKIADLSATLTWRRHDAVVEQVSQIRTGAVDWFDLAARYKVSEEVELYGGVNNIADRDPPLIRGQFFNTDGQTYDVLGRYVFGGVSLRF